MTVKEAKTVLDAAKAAYAAGGSPYDLAAAKEKLEAATRRKHMMMG